ncbi:hypothetical protein HNV08_06380 [Winogradskyella eckloniae]|uniref:hypothetical protein n=1 Tax=Winogradskyella eckloniae TaxID=1089306 RepID=UPI0015644DB8|nr:hypothetical protein [Winogradskyella eckloniae]NRD19668.1 hypothetical protein [Winogradskyella eckloniae]
MLFLTMGLFSYGQEIIFQKNENPTARDLLQLQKLNSHGDSLILESKTLKIHQIDILNENYFETIKIDSVKARIGLSHVPIGNYVVQAKVTRHWIVMYIEKTKTISADIDFMEIIANAKRNKVTKTAIHLNDEHLVSKEKIIENQTEEKTMYWVVYESNTHLSSTKTMSLKYPEEIDDLISKIRIETKSKVGRHNKLLVYEVYNTSEFMRRQLRDITYYKSTKSKLFNVVPVYNSDKEQRYRSLANVSYQ